MEQIGDDTISAILRNSDGGDFSSADLEVIRKFLVKTKSVNILQNAETKRYESFQQTR